MKNLIFVLLAFLFISFYTYSQVSHTVNFSEGKINLSELKAADQNNYVRVNFSDFRMSDEVGKPELPVKYIRLIIPSNQDVKSVNIVSAVQKIMNISNAVYPAQPPVITSL